MSLKVENTTKLGLTTIDGTISIDVLPAHVKRLSKKFAMDAAASDTKIRTNIQTFATYFEQAGFVCPLPRQYESARRGGLPGVPPLVRALLSAELTSGVLMGLQDLDAIVGDLFFGLAAGGEQFESRDGVISCRTGEPIISDVEGVVASLFQGPDLRTALTEETRRPIFYVFAVPTMADEAVDYGVTRAVAALPWASEPDVAQWPGS